MPLSKPHELFKKGFRDGWAIGAFNTANLELTQAIARGLEAARSPGIIQVSEKSIEYAGFVTLREIIKNVADEVDVPIIMHLDHGKSYEVAERCIEGGYASVMIDGSALPIEENIQMTRKVVEKAHAHGVWVEGEVGEMAGKEGMRAQDVSVNDAHLTNPEEAEVFVRETGVDALAVSVGTLHGSFQGDEKLRAELLETIHARIPIPLVLHGASGLPNDDLQAAVSRGVTKVNIDTELREAFHYAIERRETTGETGSVDPRILLGKARDAVQKAVEQKIKFLGSAEKNRI